ncbi:MAG: DHA1 family tetracycline resistance protein-like MFS transporter [Arenicella sp.]
MDRNAFIHLQKGLTLSLCLPIYGKWSYIGLKLLPFKLSSIAKPKLNKKAPLFFIIVTVMLDAMGIGLIMPVMPELIQEVSHTSMADAALWGGLLTTSYAAMQFLFGPLLGNLSDRFGRRPVLIISLVFMGLDYFLMAIAPSLLLLFIARIISGITGATYSTAAAYLSDSSAKGQRSANFGYIGGAFGIGFVLGPAIGGFLAEFGVRMPFIIAGVLALMNAAFGLLVLPETLARHNRRTFEWARTNPFTALLRIRNLPMVGSLMFVVLIYSTANYVYPSVWSFFTIEKFAWEPKMIGISLAVYGICAAFIQVVVLSVMIRKFGVERTAIIGMLISVVAFAFLIMIDNSFLIFVGMPIIALGAVVSPALQGMMADQVSDDEQGELQGVFASVMALSAIISPLIMTYTFQQFTKADTIYYLPGAPFAAAALLTIAAMVAFYLSRAERHAYAN